MKKKIKLDHLQIKSFVTNLSDNEKNTVAGGVISVTITIQVSILMRCFEAQPSTNQHSPDCPEYVTSEDFQNPWVIPGQDLSIIA